MASNDRATIIAVGDVCVDRDDPHSMFDLVRNDLEQADVTSARSRRRIPRAGRRVPSCACRCAPRPRTSMPSHARDSTSPLSRATTAWIGARTRFSTRSSTCNSKGVKVVGAGKNLAAAREPVISETPRRHRRLARGPVRSFRTTTGRTRSARAARRRGPHAVRSDRARPAGHAAADPVLSVRGRSRRDELRHRPARERVDVVARLDALGHPLQGSGDRAVPEDLRPGRDRRGRRHGARPSRAHPQSRRDVQGRSRSSTACATSPSTCTCRRRSGTTPCGASASRS